ncbi:MAG: hypothetical protein JW810_07615, partial [Sedimentisphaerales bacterium]|nr:hypothetical protein [Sedimentisphaerales bacterium]
MRSIKQARNKAQGSVENPARDCRLSLETLEPRVLLSVQYSLTDLGTLGGDFSVALGINAGGQVVGYSGDDAGVTRAFLWENGAMSTLPTATVGAETSYAYGISDSGSIAGTMKLTTGEIRGFYFNGSTVTNIHTVANGYASYVWALNDAGQVVGNYNDGSHDHAFLWDSTDGMQALGTTYGKAYDINGAGRVAGQTLAGTGYNHACVFQSGTVTDIHALSTTDSSALGLNDVGQVVGWYRYQFNDTHAFVWDSISGMQDLGTLGDDNGMAWSINNSGQIVGSDYVSMSTQHAFIYENGAMTDLNSLIPAGTGWTLVTANDINDAGQIIGKGLVGGSSTWRAFLLTPVETELPAAGLTVSDITTADGTSHGFSVTYTDNVAVDVSTLDDDDIRVTGPNGFDEPAVFEGVDNGADGAVRVATYRIGAPGGSWDDGDNGAYSIVIASGAVGDTSGNYVAAGTLGQFSVVISGDGPAASGPKVMMHQPSVTTAGPLDAVEITFDTTVNAGTFAAADVSLTDPDGDPVTATVVTPVGAFTWRIDFPAQSAAGVYCLKIGPNIQDALGNPMNQDGDTVNGEPVDDVYTANLSIAVSDLKIDSHTPTAGQDSGIDHLEVTFSRAIAADTFTPADVQITGPAGAINVSSVSPVSGTVYRIAFAPQTAAGSYTVRIGPDIETADGVLMNQDGDGTPAEPGDDAYQAVLTIGASVPLEGIVIRSIGCEIANNVITVRAGQKLGGEPFRVLIQNMSADWDNVSLGYYLSTDANVTADDLGYPLTTGSVRLESGAYYEAAPTADSQSSQFFAPDAPGTYYLKVKANDAWSDLITLQVAAPANDSDTTATDSVNPEIRVSGLNPNKTSFQKNEPFRVEMLLTNSGEIDYVPDMINYEYNIGVPYYNVHDRAVIYQFRYNFGWSLGQDFDAPYIPAGSAATAAQVGTVFWSATEVDLKYLSNVYSNVANPYSDTYSQVITFTHAGSWPDGAKADLNIAMSLATAAEALPGDVIPFTLSIQNSGNQYSSGGNVALYRSADADFDTGYGSDDDALIDNYNDLFELPYLMPGETKTYSGVLVMPSEAGTYYFSAFADVGGNVSESNENNNQSQVFAITVGNAQATADVTYPPIGKNTDLSDLNDATNRYIEVTYSYADPASIDGDEIALGGIGAGSVTIGKMDKIDDDTYRYEVKGDFQAGLVDVQIVADSFTNDSDQFNAAETESFGALPDLAPLQISADANAFAWDPVKKQFYYSGEFGMGLKPPAGQPFTPIIDADGMIGFDGNIVSFSG